MNARILAFFVCFLVAVSPVGAVAAADPSTDPDGAEAESDTEAESDDDGGLFQITGDRTTRGADEPAQESGPRDEPAGSDPGTWTYRPTCKLGGAGICVSGAECADGGRMYTAYYTPPGEVPEERGDVCFTDEEAPPAVQPQITNAMVMRALRRVEVPAAKLIVQPPGGKTLVNFATIFHTEADRFTRTVTLLGQKVDLEITPSSFTWRHGDSTTQTTAEPGVAYAEGRPMTDYVTHSYEDAHVTVNPAVDTTYSARFRVNGGAWRAVVGTVTIDGRPVDLRVVEGRPALVNGY